MWHPVANRDATVFENPDTLNLQRDPNPHVGFGGGGPHYCLGANLAKREITAMMNRLVERYPNTELSGPVQWTGPGPLSNVGCTLGNVPVKLRA